MKIAYKHLVSNIKENPSIEMLSDKLFQLGHEHEIEEGIFDMEFTPNRGDCLSVNGLLRDLAAFYTVVLNQDLYSKKVDDLNIDFVNHSENICSQISFLKLEVDKIPNKYKNHLNSYFTDLGLNKNNFFTDVSNYISYETGQPTHCYDADKIDGRLSFHEIDRQEDFETLFGDKITLTGKNSVFSVNDNVVNLAGIIGNKSSSCSVETKVALIECAYFKPEAIIGKSLRYGIQSDAAHKFERGVDPNCHQKVLRRFIQIINEHSDIKHMSMISFNNDYSNNVIPIDVNKINKIIGININEETYLNYLNKLSFSNKNRSIIVPSFRSDVKTCNDLAEEVARVIGYDNIEVSSIEIPNKHKLPQKSIEDKLRFLLLDHGFYEVINPPFVGLASNNAITVDNPLDSSREFLRTNLTNSLVENLLFNEKRQQDSIKLFEISDVYSSNNGINKTRQLSIVASGRVGHNFEDFSKKINIKYLTSLFKKDMPNQDFNFQVFSRDSLDTKINNEIITCEVDINDINDDILSYEPISKLPINYNKFHTISDYPSSFKDISFSIKDFSKANDLQYLMLNFKDDIIKSVYIFDYFKNEKKEEIKIGFRFIFQSKYKTLTSKEIDFVYNDLIHKSLKIKGIEIPGLYSKNESN